MDENKYVCVISNGRSKMHIVGRGCVLLDGRCFVVGPEGTQHTDHSNNNEDTN